MSQELQLAMTNLMNVQVKLSERQVNSDNEYLELKKQCLELKQLQMESHIQFEKERLEGQRRWEEMKVSEERNRLAAEQRWRQYQRESEERWNKHLASEREERDRILEILHEHTAVLRRLPDAIKNKIGLTA